MSKLIHLADRLEQIAEQPGFAQLQHWEDKVIEINDLLGPEIEKLKAVKAELVKDGVFKLAKAREVHESSGHDMSPQTNDMRGTLMVNAKQLEGTLREAKQLVEALSKLDWSLVG